MRSQLECTPLRRRRSETDRPAEDHAHHVEALHYHRLQTFSDLMAVDCYALFSYIKLGLPSNQISIRRLRSSEG